MEPPEIATEIEEVVPEEDDDGKLKNPILSTNDMCKASNWVHYTKNILRCNRLVHPDEPPVEGEEEEDPDAKKRRQQAADPLEPRLKEITKDCKVKGGYAAWSIR